MDQLIIVPRNIQLTIMQVEQLQQLADGISYKEIAEKRHCSVSAVKKVSADIFAKFNVSTAVAAVSHGFRYGLIK